MKFHSFSLSSRKAWNVMAGKLLEAACWMLGTFGQDSRFTTCHWRSILSSFHYRDTLIQRKWGSNLLSHFSPIDNQFSFNSRYSIILKFVASPEILSWFIINEGINIRFGSPHMISFNIALKSLKCSHCGRSIHLFPRFNTKVRMLWTWTLFACLRTTESVDC